MNFIVRLWNRLFLEERSSISLSIFRIVLAFTVIAHVIPSFFHMGDNYLGTAYKEYNVSIFPVYIIEVPYWRKQQILYQCDDKQVRF